MQLIVHLTTLQRLQPVKVEITTNNTHKNKNTGNASNFWETFCSVISAFLEIIGTVFFG
jgi:hypothetical protein